LRLEDRDPAAVRAEAVGRHTLAELLGLEGRGEHIHGHGIEQAHGYSASCAGLPKDACSSP
jgi:hypothetical protein